ncbi:10748_t:CDS:10, partial [Entrophospora sp. SA101]
QAYTLVGNKSNESINNANIRERFVMKCMEILNALQHTLNELNKIEDQRNIENKIHHGPELLGIRDLGLIHTMIEIVITWGVYPCLMEGVGISLSRRTRSAYIQNEFLNDLKKEDKSFNANTTTAGKYFKLFKLSKSLFDILFNSSSTPSIYTSISTILYSKYLTDIYAILLQLSYGPLQLKSENSISSSNDEPQENHNEISGNIIYEIDQSELEKMRKESIRMFNEIFQRTSSLQSLNSLTILLGSHINPSPKWLINVCGKFLTQILLRPNGVPEVIDFMIDGEEVSLSKLDTISKLILSIPSQIKSVEEYFSIICPQLLQLIQPISSTTLSSQITSSRSTAAAFTITRLANKYPAMAKRFIISNIFSSLWKWWGISSEEHKQIFEQQMNSSVFITKDLGPPIVDEASLQSTITMIHHILVGSEPIPDLLQMFLEDSIAPLYYLYEFSCSSKSYLKEYVFEILLSYFKIVTVIEGIEAFKEIIFKKNKNFQAPDVGKTGEVYFSPGPSGGIMMRLRITSIDLSPTLSTISVDLFVNLIKSINNNDLTSDFFVYLLNEYTSLKVQRHLIDSTRSKHLLTLLHLVLAIIESLGSKFLQKPGHIIAFVNNVLENYDQKELNKEKSKKNEAKTSLLDELNNIVADQNDDIMESDSDGQENDELLSLALALLTSLLADNYILNIVKDNLVSFQNHPSPSIRSLANNLILNISIKNATQESSNSSAESFKQQESLKNFQEAMVLLQDDVLPIKAHGIAMLREMMKKGLSSLTDLHGEKVMKKLMIIYSNAKENTDNRLRVGEAILQTIQRSGDVLGKYITTLLPPLLNVLNKNDDIYLHVSALSIIGCACETSPLALSMWFRDIVNCSLNIIDTQKEIEVRRACVVLLSSLFRGLASHSQSLYLIPSDLLQKTYLRLKYIEETDNDELTKYQARICISDLDSMFRVAFLVYEIQVFLNNVKKSNKKIDVEKIELKNLTTLSFVHFKLAANLIDDEIGVFKENHIDGLQINISLIYLLYLLEKYLVTRYYKDVASRDLVSNDPRFAPTFEGSKDSSSRAHAKWSRYDPHFNMKKCKRKDDGNVY